MTSSYLDRLKKAAPLADIVVASHPYLGKILHEIAGEAEFWFEAHNVELTLKMNLLPKSDFAITLLESVAEVEGYCWSKAKLVFACTKQDLLKLEEIYGNSIAIKIEVPNGTSANEVPFVNQMERKRRKSYLGYANQFLTIFMGSWHGPNIEAAKFIIELAKLMPEIIFIIVGSVCGAIAHLPITENVKLIGVVDDQEKAVLLGAADIALNPMSSGSGSNLKVLDYFSAGIPLLSSEFGVRGINVVDGKHYIKADIINFNNYINEFKSNNNIEKIISLSRKLIEDDYDWSVIVERFHKKNLESII
jgi:glycosyltransferase involved in cell wall biosynthesis